MNTLGFIILTTALSFAVIFISFYASHINRQLKRLNGHLSAMKQNLENHRRVHAILASERDAKETLVTELQTRNAELKQDISRLQGEIEAVNLRYKPKRGKDGKFVSKTNNATVEKDVSKSDIRSLSSLKPNEAILVLNDFERDSIIKLMEDANKMWIGGARASSVIPQLEYPYCIGLHVLYNERLACDTVTFTKDELHKTILPASDFLPKEQKDDKSEVHTKDAHVTTVDTTGTEQADESPTELPTTRDWSVPQAFPMGYIARKGDVVFMEGHGVVSAGTKGKIVSWYEHISTVQVDCFKLHVSSHKLAPLNPTDHPQHPQFKGKK